MVQSGYKCILFFLMVGQETTASTLSFMLAETGKHPEVENRSVIILINIKVANLHNWDNSKRDM